MSGRNPPVLLGYVCRRCGKSVPISEDAGISRLCVYCAPCAETVMARRARHPAPPVERRRRVYFSRERNEYREYRGDCWPDGLFAGRDVEEVS